MAGKPDSTSFERDCLDAYYAYMATDPRCKTSAARALGIPVSTLRHRLAVAIARDLPGVLRGAVPEGMEVRERVRSYDRDGNLQHETIRTVREGADEQFEVPAGHQVKGVSAFVDADGRVRSTWIKTRTTTISEEILVEAIRRAVDLYVPAAPVDPVPLDRPYDRSLLVLHPLPDLHLGMRADAREGQMAWNLAKAVATYKDVMRRLIVRVPSAEVGVILGGGDLLHYDDETMATRRSGNRMDGSDSYAECLAQAQLLLVYQVELALSAYRRVEVRVLRGNHDPDSALAVAHYLRAWYRDNPRVAVDISPGLFWMRQHGRVLLAATHGHEAKISDMPGIMAADYPRAWGETDWRYAHGFHIHHATRSSGEANGVEWETHAAPVPRDAYHQRNRYRSQRALCAIAYHDTFGHRGRVIETLGGSLSD